jgi:hypothetical protein
MTVERRRARIVGQLRQEARFSMLAKRINRCRKGLCGRCGDLCPVKAGRWAGGNVPKVVDLLTSRRPGPFLLRYTRGVWARKDGKLALASPSNGQQLRWATINEPILTSQAGVEKAFRRAFDNLNEPNVVAVGMTDAWYGHERWEIGASLIVAGVAERRLYEVFPDGFLVITPISDVSKLLHKLLADSRRAKRTPVMSLIAGMPKRRQREYFAWLAGMKPNRRLFRYGCDRYFNRLEKTKKVSQTGPEKPHPFPFWLQHHWFGYHHRGCLCRACGGPGKHSLRR